MGNLVIDIWVKNKLVKRFDDVGDEFQSGRLKWIENFVNIVEKTKFSFTIWFE